MFGSIEIGRVLGIQVRVHWTFLVAIPIFMMMHVQLPWLLLLFGVVLLHELGHSVVARRFGIRVLDITLWPLGGMARMNEIPEDSKVEGLIAVAGPAVNFALAFLVLPIFLWSSLGTAADGSLASTVSTGSGYFLAINLMLGGFNLLPAFPMDGGRVLRAWLGRKGDWVGATERAVQVGKVLAVAMFLFGFVTGWGGMLPLIGVFVWFAGSRELLGVRMRHARAASGFGPIPGFPPPGFGGPADHFESARPVHHEAPPRPAAYAGPAVFGGAQRPRGDAVPHPGRGGVSDDEIARLESFRGRLRRADEDE